MKKFSMKKIMQAQEAREETKRDLDYELIKFNKFMARNEESATPAKPETIAYKRQQIDAAKDADTMAVNALSVELGKLQDLIDAAEGRATARTITPDNIISALEDVEDRLNISKKAMQGVTVKIDCNAQSFPSAYKYTPESTYFAAEYKSGYWTITDIWRSTTAGPTIGHCVTLTDEAKAAILARCERF